MLNYPKISICIPTYNQAMYLPFTVEGALAQDYPNLEIVISDNHSTDNTPKYLATLKDDRVRVIQPPHHLNMVENFRFCFNQSRGTYVNMISSDDVLLPGFISKLASALDSHPSAAFAYTPVHLIDAKGQIIGMERHLGGSFFRKGNEELGRFLRGSTSPFISALIRRDCFEASGGFGQLTMVGDYEIQLRWVQTGDVVYHDELLAQFRVWSTLERDSRLPLEIREIAEIYETTVAEILRSRPDLKEDAIKGRKARARSFARLLGMLSGKPEFAEAARQVLKIYDSPEIRLTIRLHQWGLSGLILAGVRAKRWLRQKVKALLYQPINRIG